MDASNWITAFQSRLTDARNKPCEEIFLEVFDVGITGQYVKVNLETFFNEGAGLQFINIVTSEVSSGKQLQKEMANKFILGYLDISIYYYAEFVAGLYISFSSR